MNLLTKCYLVLLLLYGSFANADTVPGSVTIAAASDNSSIDAIATSLERRLRDREIDVTRQYDLPDETDRIASSSMIVSIGNQSNTAITGVYQHHTLLTIGSNDIEPVTGQHAHLILKHPVCRQLYLISQLSEQFRTVSMISSKAVTDNSINRCAASMELDVTLFNREAGESVNSLITRALSSDVLLATPDIEIYNSRTIKNVLLLSYRKRIPVIGFSKSFVKAGALAALYSSPAMVARQADNIIEAYQRQGRFSSTVYTLDDFGIAINSQVSNSLGIEIEDTESIRRKILDGGRHE